MWKILFMLWCASQKKIQPTLLKKSCDFIILEKDKHSHMIPWLKVSHNVGQPIAVITYFNIPFNWWNCDIRFNIKGTFQDQNKQFHVSRTNGYFPQRWKIRLWKRRLYGYGWLLKNSALAGFYHLLVSS